MRCGVVSRRPANGCNADQVTADRTVADKLPAANAVPLLTFSASVKLMNFFYLREETRRPALRDENVVIYGANLPRLLQAERDTSLRAPPKT